MNEGIISQGTGKSKSSGTVKTLPAALTVARCSCEFVPRPRGEGPMIQVEQLTKKFGTLTAVDNLSFDVPAGQMLGIIGRSGAGKSTLLRMLNRLVEPTSGRILSDAAPGGDVRALKGRDLCVWRQCCAMVF